MFAHRLADLKSVAVRARCVLINVQQLCITNLTVVMSVTGVAHLLLHRMGQLPLWQRKAEDPSVVKRPHCKSNTVTFSPAVNC